MLLRVTFAQKDSRDSVRYSAWRYAVLKRDKNTCQECSFLGDGIYIHAHHIQGWNKYPDLRFEIDNGMTLCNSCHTRLHQKIKCNLDAKGVRWNKGMKMSQEYCNKLKGRTAWNKGTSPSEETRKKISETLKGNSLSLETRKKISEALTGREFSVEHCENVSRAKKGKKLSEEHKKALSEAHLKRHERLRKGEQ